MSRKGGASRFAEVDFGVAELLEDRDRPGAWTLVLDEYPQSYVDLGDPGHLEFEYVRRLACVVDLLAPLRDPITVMHLGGGGLTLPRYVVATRPRSMQRVVERDAALIDFVRRELPLPRNADLRVRAYDARRAVEQTPAGRFDLLVTDVYSGARVPGAFGTVEFLTEAARILHPDGVYAVNIADGAPLVYARAQVATLAAVFPELCLLAEPAILRGRRFGNLVLVAAKRIGRLPIDDLATAVTRDPFPARVVHGVDLQRFVAGAKPVTDALAVESPLPPDNIFQPSGRT